MFILKDRDHPVLRTKRKEESLPPSQNIKISPAVPPYGTLTHPLKGEVFLSRSPC